MKNDRYHVPHPESNLAHIEKYPNPEGLEGVCEGVFVSNTSPGEMPNTGHYISHVDFVNGARAIEAESPHFEPEREGISTYFALLKWQVKQEGSESDLAKVSKLQIGPSNGENSGEKTYYFATQLLADLANAGLEDIDIKGIQGSRREIIWATLG